MENEEKQYQHLIGKLSREKFYNMFPNRPAVPGTLEKDFLKGELGFSIAFPPKKSTRKPTKAPKVYFDDNKAIKKALNYWGNPLLN